MKKIITLTSVALAVMLIFMSALSAFALVLYTDGDYTYADVDDYSVALYGYSGESSTLTVPAEFNNRRVAQIYSYSFEGNNNITTLDFSDNPHYVTEIGTKAFESSALSGALVLPSSLRTMSLGAFQSCTGLTSLTINMGIHDIPEQCFNRCSGLNQITLPETIETIGRLAFANITTLGKINIPRSVTYIDPNAFYNTFLTLYVYNGSYGHTYAESNHLPYTLIDPPVEPTEPINPTEIIEPTAAPTEAPTEVPTQSGYLLGDADGDDVVDTTDATVIQRHICHISLSIPVETLMHGDVDRDAELDVIDSTFIMRYSALINVPYPIGEWITP